MITSLGVINFPNIEYLADTEGGKSHWESGNYNRKLSAVSISPLALCPVTGCVLSRLQFSYLVCRTQLTTRGWNHTGKSQPPLGHKRGGIWMRACTHTHTRKRSRTSTRDLPGWWGVTVSAAGLPLEYPWQFSLQCYWREILMKEGTSPVVGKYLRLKLV